MFSGVFHKVTMMKGFWDNCRAVLIFILAVSGFWRSTGRADSTFNSTASPRPDGTNYDVFIEIAVVTNNGVGATISSPLLSVKDGTNDVLFTILFQTPLMEIDVFTVNVPADVLTNSVTLTWTNYSTDLRIVTAPLFLTQPQSQSVFVGSTATFSAQAAHTSGYQWQRNGTNLVEGGHFIGVTNPTLIISNVQMRDAGDYTVIANHPITPATADATLSVYKPILLGLGSIPSGGFTLMVANEDGSPFEPERIPNLQVYSATNLVPGLSTWNLETNGGSVSNGVLQIGFPNDGSRGKYWRVLEQ